MRSPLPLQVMLLLLPCAIPILASDSPPPSATGPSPDPNAVNQQMLMYLRVQEARLRELRELKDRITSNPEDAAAVERLFDAVSGANTDTGAVAVLGQLRSDTRTRGKLSPEFDSKAVVKLTALLKHPNYFVRREAIIALGKFGFAARGSVEAIAGFLQERERDISLAAARALASIGPFASSSVPDLILALDADENWLGPEAAKALGAMGSKAEDALPKLITKAQDWRGEPRIVAAEALGSIDRTDQSSLEVLRWSLKVEPPYLRRVAIAALESLAKTGRDRKPKVIELLSRASEDPDEEVSHAAALTISRLSSLADKE